jgi:metal-responsive CopG/Arc/MetJ family transcriptional regulator
MDKAHKTGLLRNPRRKPTREERHLSSATATKKVIVEFPEELLKRTEEVASELSKNRSELIRSAVTCYLERRKKDEFEKSLAEGYRAYADLDRQIAEEFAHSDDDTL